MKPVKPRGKPHNVLKTWLDTCLCDGIDLTAWDKQFLADASGQLMGSGTLSLKSQQTLQRLYETKTP